MKYRVIKKSYPDGKQWFYLQCKSWRFGKWRQLEPSAYRPDYDGLWIGFPTEEQAIQTCDELNAPTIVPITSVVYPPSIPDFKRIPAAPPFKKQ